MIPWQPLEQHRGRTRLTRLPGRSPHTEAVHRVRVAVDLDLPAMGYRTLRLRRASDDRPLRMPGLLPGLAVDGRTVANQHLSATAEPDGTVTLHDQRTGRTLRGLLGFDSSGDIGDGWNYEGPFNNRTVGSVGGPAQHRSWSRTARCRRRWRSPIAWLCPRRSTIAASSAASVTRR